MRVTPLGLAVAAMLLVALRGATAAEPPAPVVEAEEDVYSYRSADNGAGPMWCHGSTCLVRAGSELFASGLETLDGVKPLNNCRWLLFHRAGDGWRQVMADPTGRTREPCPMVGLPDGRLLLSVNPTLVENPNVQGGPARPEILLFDAAKPDKPRETIVPPWQGEPTFTEHSYRSFAADGQTGEVVLFQNVGMTHAEWTFRDADGKWTAQGRLVWPWGAEYDQPQPIRVCYPNIAVKNRAVYFCGVSDIVEPYAKWRALKKELTGRDWDYDFRRLFYTWTPDVTKTKFHDWIEIASRDKTCGGISPQDLWVAPDGAVHVLWSEQATDARLRDKLFVDTKQTHALNYAVVRDGKVTLRRTIALGGEGVSGEIPGGGCFQVTPDGRLYVFYYVSGAAEGKPVSENRVVVLSADGTPTAAARVGLSHPMTSFFTVTPRAGSPPSTTLELLGTRADSLLSISYARVRLE
ncbi:MAG: hypothetical protein NTW96_02165 [Planctomycetia bacterium]|nr:hypothetical protein [Planctomycetia bacterium]